MTAQEPTIGKNKRRGPDIWIRTLHLLGIISWLLLIALLIVVETARPQFESFFDRFYGLNLRTTWDMNLAPYIGMVTAVGLLISFTGLLISTRRHRRKEDRLPFSLFLTGTGFVISFCACLYYL